MPEDLAKELEKIPNKSRFITQALREKFKREQKEKLNSLMIEGYKNTPKEDKESRRDWDKATLKDWE
jgi:hypothetical protein